MIKVLFIVPNLETNGIARQATRLAAGLGRERFDVRICILGRSGPWEAKVANAGVGIEKIGWTRPVDLRPIARLVGVARSFRPHVIHAYGLAAMTAGVLVRLSAGGRLLLSSFAPGVPNGQAASWRNRSLLRRANHIIAGGPCEASLAQEAGVSSTRIVKIRPAVGAVDPLPPPEVRESLGLPPDARLIACIGPLEYRKGFYNAIWVCDILRYVYDNFHLAFIGSGPDEANLRRLVGRTQAANHVHFLGWREDVASILSEVDVVWAPSRGNTGINAVLEAMAAGRPVVAARQPALAELVQDGVTGFLVPVNDQGAIARQTRQILDSPERAERMGQAARQAVAASHAPASQIDAYARLYEDVA
jgi:glycosyltransferase involved in cell wall biosynthesis